MRTSRRSRLRRVLPLLALAGALAACDDLLDVKQPGLITDEDSKANQALLEPIVNDAEGEYHAAFNWMANSGAALSDEALFGHGWSPWEEYDNRDVTPSGGAWDGIGYGYLARARVAGSRAIERVQALGGTQEQLARALVYTGYSTVLEADYMCEVVLNGGAPIMPQEAYDSAVALFTAAATAATAAGRTDLVNLANVGAARAYLNQGNFAKAAEFAAKVPADFAAYVKFVDADFGQWSDKYNLFARTSGFKSATEFSLGLDSAMWAGKSDLRVPFLSDSTTPMFTSKPYVRRSYVPFIPSSFEGWTPGNRKLIPGDAGIRFASGLEAQYILAEAALNGAGSWSESQVLAFVNARRAVGAGRPDDFTGTDLKAELRRQRMLDLYFAGYRVPDLLRYQRLYGIDLWPKGKIGGFPPEAPYTYGTTTCLPMAASEITANPRAGG
ncbi:MAG: hypothetical protein IRZ00_13195 [Gemmatimonadetes bacterium]|nr:hypothetical protein [Gemmatimonadota bacterium]